jgi:hypothetical protein
VERKFFAGAVCIIEAVEWRTTLCAGRYQESYRILRQSYHSSGRRSWKVARIFGVSVMMEYLLLYSETGAGKTQQRRPSWTLLISINNRRQASAATQLIQEEHHYLHQPYLIEATVRPLLMEETGLHFSLWEVTWYSMVGNISCNREAGRVCCRFVFA